MLGVTTQVPVWYGSGGISRESTIDEIFNLNFDMAQALYNGNQNLPDEKKILVNVSKDGKNMISTKGKATTSITFAIAEAVESTGIERHKLCFELRFEPTSTKVKLTMKRSSQHHYQHYNILYPNS
jgi:malate/lactate dehydrogenase